MKNIYDKVALIVGAGAVENSWQPVIRALQPSYDFEIDSDCANSIFARLVYLMRYYSTSTSPGAKEYLKAITDGVNELKNNVAKELTIAEENRSIRARKEFKDILYRFVFSEIHKFVLISTNWDTVINNEINILGESNYPIEGSNIETINIHGSIISPNGLYLPSEITKESYRSNDEDIKIGTIHGSVWRTLEQSNKTILYGLSLDPLDAELCQTLAAGWSSPNLREILIIDPEHGKVARRVKLLMDKRYKASISGYHPANLNLKKSY